MHRTFVAVGVSWAISACAPPPRAEPVRASPPPPRAVEDPAALASGPTATFVKATPEKGSRLLVSSKSTVSSHVDMLLSERPMSIDLASTSRFEYARVCVEPRGTGCASARAEILHDEVETSGPPMGQPKHESLIGQAFLIDAARPLRVSKPDPPPAKDRDLDRVRERLTTDDPDRIVAALPDRPLHVGDVLDELDRVLMGELPGDRPAEAKIRRATSRSIVTAIRQEGGSTVVVVRTDFGADLDIPTAGADLTAGRAHLDGRTLLVLRVSPASPVSRQTHTHIETSMRQKEVPSNIILETDETTTWK